MEIKFKDNDGLVITESDAILSGDFRKSFFEKEISIKEEIYSEHQLHRLILHNWNAVSHQYLIKKYNKPNIDGLSIIDYQFYEGGFKLEKMYAYDLLKNNQLLGRNHTLFDKKGRIIGHENIQDKFGGDLFSKWKYYWDENENPDKEVFECFFNLETNEITEIYFNQEHICSLGQESFSLLPEDIGELMQITGMSKELATYYTNPSIIPNFKKIKP